MIVKLPIEHHLEFLSLKGGCIGLSESTLVKMLHCWKSHVTVHISETSDHSYPLKKYCPKNSDASDSEEDIPRGRQQYGKKLSQPLLLHVIKKSMLYVLTMPLPV